MTAPTWAERGLRPGDEAHIPRWLDELRYAEWNATERLSKAPGWPYWSNEAELAALERADPTKPEHAVWLPTGQGERGGG